LGYSNIHKGFKCLDLATGHIYISHDVISDENSFPFSKLCSNAGPKLRYVILLPPPALSNIFFEVELIIDHKTNDSNVTNTFQDLQLEREETPTDNGSNSEENGIGTEIKKTHQLHRLWDMIPHALC
jgi:hypothetical protein